MSSVNRQAANREFRDFVALKFSQDGFKVIIPPYLRNPFNLYVTKGQTFFALIVKTGQPYTPQNVKWGTALLEYDDIPAHARRLYWYRCAKYDSHRVWEIKPVDGLVPIVNPLAHLLPPPLDKKTIRRQLRQFTST